MLRKYAQANEVAPTGKGAAVAGGVIAVLEQFARMEPFTSRPGVTFPDLWLRPWQIAQDLKGGSKVRGHIKERSPGHWAIVLDHRDAGGKRKRRWHSFAGTKRQAQVECAG